VNVPLHEGVPALAFCATIRPSIPKARTNTMVIQRAFFIGNLLAQRRFFAGALAFALTVGLALAVTRLLAVIKQTV
jgi:hypothetical protein